MSGVHNRIKIGECQVCYEGGSHLGSAGRHLDYLHFPPAVVAVSVGRPGATPEHWLLPVPVTHGLKLSISRGYKMRSVIP